MRENKNKNIKHFIKLNVNSFPSKISRKKQILTYNIFLNFD